VWVKAVPGARRDEVAGLLGDRLKVRVAAPPEDGRANAAVGRVLAAALGVQAGRVRLSSDGANPLKVFVVEGLSAAEASARLRAGGVG
jgi:hypothetical protein